MSPARVQEVQEAGRHLQSGPALMVRARAPVALRPPGLSSFLAYLLFLSIPQISVAYLL